MKRGLSLLAGTAAILAVALHLSLTAAEPEAKKTEKDVSELMRNKLASSQKVLEGLVTEDFKLIREGAEELRQTAEAAEWRRYKDPVYDHYSAEFLRLSEKLIKLAEDGNLEGASFTYMHGTTTCISCHQHVRDVIRIADDQPEATYPQSQLPKLPKKY